MSESGGNSMKAADGVQIAGRPEAAIRSAARFALELAGKSKHCEAVSDCAHCNLTFLATWAENMLTDLSRAEERERVLREALNRIKAAVGTSTEAWHIANAALTAAPEQPDCGVCPDCKSTTRSFRGRRGDEHGEWVCDNEWHAPEQGKEAK